MSAYSTDQIITNGDMSADVTSEVVDFRYLRHVFVEYASTSGTAPTGSLALQGSTDQVTWNDIATQAFSGSDLAGILSDSHGAYLYVRVKYTRTSGTATLNVRFSAKS